MPQDQTPWYADGLDFTCTQCGHCCTGGTGFVWVTEAEIGAVAEFLQLPMAGVCREYCRKVGTRISLKERLRIGGDYDCVFLADQAITPDQATTAVGGSTSTRLSLAAAPGQLPPGQRGCRVYSVRPAQCRTWPFWEGNLASPEAWEKSTRRCPGMNHGRHYSWQEIAAVLAGPTPIASLPGSSS